MSEWAGEYQGYNLDELVQSVNSAVATVGEMESDVSDLKEGLQVKCSLFFCGRAVTFKDFGFNKMNQFIDDLKEFCEPSAEPVFDGKKAITVTLIPRGKKNNAVKT